MYEDYCDISHLPVMIEAISKSFSPLVLSSWTRHPLDDGETSGWSTETFSAKSQDPYHEELTSWQILSFLFEKRVFICASRLLIYFAGWNIPLILMPALSCFEDHEGKTTWLREQHWLDPSDSFFSFHQSKGFSTRVTELFTFLEDCTRARLKT